MPCKFDSWDVCRPVPCPCEGGCKGVLKSEGRNIADTLTFLQCDTCGCTHVAYDFQKKGERTT